MSNFIVWPVMKYNYIRESRKREFLFQLITVPVNHCTIHAKAENSYSILQSHTLYYCMQPDAFTKFAEIC